MRAWTCTLAEPRMPHEKAQRDKFKDAARVHDFDPAEKRGQSA